MLLGQPVQLRANSMSTKHLVNNVVLCQVFLSSALNVLSFEWLTISLALEGKNGPF
jgi:hypothetical protein